VMNLEVLEIVVTVMIAVGSVIGFYVRRMYARMDKQEGDIKEIKGELTEHRMHSAANHISRQEFHDSFKEMKDEIRDIVRHISTKIDKLAEQQRK